MNNSIPELDSIRSAVTDWAIKIYEWSFSEIFRERQRNLLIGTAVLIALCFSMVKVESIPVGPAEAKPANASEAKKTPDSEKPETVNLKVEGTDAAVCLTLAFCLYMLPIFAMTAMRDSKRLFFFRAAITAQLQESLNVFRSLSNVQIEKASVFKALNDEAMKFIERMREAKTVEERIAIDGELSEFKKKNKYDEIYQEILDASVGKNKILVSESEFFLKSLTQGKNLQTVMVIAEIGFPILFGAAGILIASYKLTYG